ncbi:hypothetical protein SUGI_1095540 [Cryptomeria japonica]|nr:hypothetical protein SUGI_1095540 [Cryptomeria japonica]
MVERPNHKWAENKEESGKDKYKPQESRVQNLPRLCRRHRGMNGGNYSRQPRAFKFNNLARGNEYLGSSGIGGKTGKFTGCAPERIGDVDEEVMVG